MSTDPTDQPVPEQTGGVRRRVFIGSIGASAAGLVAACSRASPEVDIPAPGVGAQQRGGPGHLDEQDPPPTSPVGLEVLNMQQARTVDAAAGRIIPGDDDEPGAREAGAVYYIDHLLATHAGYPEPAYMEGPFAQTYEGEEPPEENGVIWVHQDELERYGRQSPLVPREIYQMGLARLDLLSRERFDSDFADASEDEQDELLEAVEDEEDDDVTEIFGELAPGKFFDLLRQYVIEGFLSDPLYGGNRDMVGWHHVGYPGARRSYSPQDMLNENFDVTPQSLLDLPAINPDRGDHRHHADGDGNIPALRQRHPLGPID